MKSANAITRQHDTQVTEASVPHVDADVARKISSAWMDIVAAETHLETMGCGVAPFRVVPAAQNAMAAMVSDLLPRDVRVMCVNMQSHGWMSATHQNVTDILRTYIGKIFASNVMPLSAEDSVNAMKKGPMNIVALHVDSGADWNDVRSVSAGAVKAGVPMLMLVSAGVPAPEGVAIDRVADWASAVGKIREACEQVRDSGAIRVIAMDDIDAASIENAMMEAAGIAPAAWQESIEKNNDGAEIAANAAYQSPVESF